MLEEKNDNLPQADGEQNEIQPTEIQTETTESNEEITAAGKLLWIFDGALEDESDEEMVGISLGKDVWGELLRVGLSDGSEVTKEQYENNTNESASSIDFQLKFDQTIVK